VTCYFRQLKEIFQKAGIEVTKENRRKIDEVIRSILGVKSGNCPDVWKEVKKRITEDEADFVSKLQTTWKKRK
jgi:predicted Fe-Mo cluster-binding NifX family protein